VSLRQGEERHEVDGVGGDSQVEVGEAVEEERDDPEERPERHVAKKGKSLKTFLIGLDMRPQLDLY
jgi:hypothetical protein